MLVSGRPAQYTVFKFDIVPNDWLRENDFGKEKDVSFESYMNIRDNLKDDEMESIYLPDFKDEYFWKVAGKHVYFYYNLESQLLMVYIAGW